MSERTSPIDELILIRKEGLDKILLEELRTLCLKGNGNDKIITSCYKCKQGQLTVRIKIESKEEIDYEIEGITEKAQMQKYTGSFNFSCNHCSIDPLLLHGHFVSKVHEEMYKFPPNPNHIDKICGKFKQISDKL